MLTLNVPETDGTALKFPVETRPKATLAWLDRLPFASPVDAARQLVMALDALNRRALGDEERYTLLALYRPVVARIASSLETLLIESGIPPSEQHRKAGGLLRELMIEHSIGYKHILLGLNKRRFGRNPSRRGAEVTARLLTALLDIQTASHLTYSSPPDDLWLDLHQLYLFAQANGTADLAVDDALPASLVYRQSMLLALADPPHMIRSDLLHTRMNLETFAARAVLGPATANPALCGFVINTDSNHGPSQLPVSPREGQLWLDTEALCQHLHDMATRLHQNASPQQVGLPPGMKSEQSLNLSHYLLKQWRPGLQRAFKRYTVSGNPVQVVTGVSTIHRLLEREAHAIQIETASHDHLRINDVGLVFITPAAVNPTRWTTLNDSAAGLALCSMPDTPLNLKVGEALAMRSDDTAEWSLAVIRWIRMRDAKQVELGVERLSPRMLPMWVRTLHDPRTLNPEPALFVPGLPALKQPDRLLLPRPVYQSGIHAEVWNTPDQRHTLTFGRRLMHTASFDLIDFTLLESNTPP